MGKHSPIVPRIPNPLLSASTIQPFCNQGLAHSFARRRACIHLAFNSLRTLSIPTGVVSPHAFLSNVRILNVPNVPTLVFTMACRLLVCFFRVPSFIFNPLQPLFRKHPGGVVGQSGGGLGRVGCPLCASCSALPQRTLRLGVIFLFSGLPSPSRSRADAILFAPHGEIRPRNVRTRSRRARQVLTGDRAGSPRPAPHQLQNLLRLLHALR